MLVRDERFKLCLVTDRGFRSSSEFLRTIEMAIDNGVGMIQFREKVDHRGHALLPDREIYRIGCQVRALTRAKGALLIVDDRLDLAMAIDADGIHVGQQDLPLSVVRKLWLPDRIYGLSVSTKIEADAAQVDGADYLGVGAVFPTGTKLDAPSAGLEILSAITHATTLPVMAIGGINLTNVDQVIKTGCAGIAVVSAIWGAMDPAVASAQLSARTAQM